MFREGLGYARNNKLEAGFIGFMAVIAAGTAVGGASILLEELGIIDLEDRNNILEKRQDENPDSGMIPLEHGLTAEII